MCTNSQGVEDLAGARVRLLRPPKHRPIKILNVIRTPLNFVKIALLLAEMRKQPGRGLTTESGWFLSSASWNFPARRTWRCCSPALVESWKKRRRWVFRASRFANRPNGPLPCRKAQTASLDLVPVAPGPKRSGCWKANEKPEALPLYGTATPPGASWISFATILPRHANPIPVLPHTPFLSFTRRIEVRKQVRRFRFHRVRAFFPTRPILSRRSCAPRPGSRS